MPKKRQDYGTNIPEYEIEALARCLLPEIQKFFEREQGKREFEECKKKQGELREDVVKADKP